MATGTESVKPAKNILQWEFVVVVAIHVSKRDDQISTLYFGRFPARTLFSFELVYTRTTTQLQ